MGRVEPLIDSNHAPSVKFSMTFIPYPCKHKFAHSRNPNSLNPLVDKNHQGAR